MNQKEYTLSNKDKKFISAVLFLQASFIVLAISLFGLYYHSENLDCKRVAKKLELAEWAVNEVNKAKAEQKLDSIKQSYKHQGIKAEEY